MEFDMMQYHKSFLICIRVEIVIIIYMKSTVAHLSLFKATVFSSICLPI